MEVINWLWIGFEVFGLRGLWNGKSRRFKGFFIYREKIIFFLTKELLGDMVNYISNEQMNTKVNEESKRSKGKK